MDYIIRQRKLQRTTTLWILGSFIDYLNESFAGSHDFMSSWNYGNINGVTYLKDNSVLTNIASGLLLIPSTPFVLVLFYAKLG